MTSRRVSNIESFIVMDVVKRAAALERSEQSPAQRILHLEVGEPSDPPPSEIISALSLSPTTTNKKHMGYSPALGTTELREALSSYYSRKYSVNVSPSNIAITNGASAGFVALFASAFDSGDSVAIASPGYPCYRHVLRLFGINVIIIPTTKETNYQPTVEQLEEVNDEHLKGVLLCSPSNPTGSILSYEELLRFSKFCKQRNLKLLVDEVYLDISRNTLPSALQIGDNDDNIIVIGSMSKYHCLTGLRVGWVITRSMKMMNAIEKCVQNMAICTATPCQHTAAVALEGHCDNILNQRVERYFNAADILVKKLNAVGFNTNPPQGAFYVYAGCNEVCSKINVDGATQLCLLFLDRCGVACTPGCDFDEERGEEFIRFSCAGTLEDVAEAGDRIVQFVTSFST